MLALIAGGGIAGPATAMALQKAGVEATIFESHPPADAEIGSYFTITANGLAALDSVGALELATDAGFPTRRNVLWNHAGRRLATLSLGSHVPGSPLARTMKRSRLARALQDEAVRRGIRIEYGRRLRDADIAADGRVVASFENDATADGDLLIGADGVHSVVRRIIDPSAPAGRYVGLTNFGGVTRAAAAAIEPEAWHLIFGRRSSAIRRRRPATPSGSRMCRDRRSRPTSVPRRRRPRGSGS
jgi:2-polyprenyl-6-methoxyphenol hydroxylase-like FAD-dependent oxidoreductase